MNCDASIESSLPHQAGKSKEKVSSARENTTMKLQDKGKSLKFEKSMEQSDSYLHVATPGKTDVGKSARDMPLGNHRKSWPSRKVTGGVEVVKHMSNVPYYLQRMERGDNVQEKALNFGVLDWSRLEKWAYIQKQAANRRGRDSPSVSNVSAAFSMFGSPSQSSRSMHCPLSQKKQSSTMGTRRSSSVADRQMKMMEMKISGKGVEFPDSKTSNVCTATVHNNCKGKSKDLDMQAVLRNISQPPDKGTLPSTSEDYDTSISEHIKVKTQISRPIVEGKSQSSIQQCLPGSLQLTENWLQDQCSVVKGMWDNLQESERRISLDSAISSSARPVEERCNSFSGKTPSDYILCTSPSPAVTHSCPLPPSSCSDETTPSSPPSCLFRSTIEHDELSVASENEVPAPNSRAKQAKQDQFTGNSSKKCLVGISDRSVKDDIKSAAAPKRELSSDRLSSADRRRMRSSSLRESSSEQQIKQTVCADNSHECKEATNRRSRRSPLRRLLDPLLKSRDRTQFSGSVVSSACIKAPESSNSNKLPLLDALKSAKVSCKSSDTGIYSSTGQATDCGGSALDETHVISTRQALLKLAWKNGLPLFMFSSDDNDILAATVGKRSISEKRDFECMYTIFTAQEVKKKSGTWINQGNKCKKPGLVYNVIAQMKVCSSKLTSYASRSYSIVREFVLFGSGLTPAIGECTSSQFSGELAAVVIEVQNRKSKSSNNNALHRKNSEGSSLKISSPSSIAVILPRGVHGLSSTGKPSSLIERWKAGGTCDCGGWDEGCMLTVLTDKNPDNGRSGPTEVLTTDGTHPVELFTQSGSREDRRAFRMVAFSDGVYSVEFGASIALLQAFSICIATLHSRKSIIISRLHYSAEALSLQEHPLADYTRMTSQKTHGGAPTSYVPDHPPLSPVGRA